jgi:hypothetical protein
VLHIQIIQITQTDSNKSKSGSVPHYIFKQIQTLVTNSNKSNSGSVPRYIFKQIEIIVTNSKQSQSGSVPRYVLDVVILGLLALLYTCCSAWGIYRSIQNWRRERGSGGNRMQLIQGLRSFSSTTVPAGKDDEGKAPPSPPTPPLPPTPPPPPPSTVLDHEPVEWRTRLARLAYNERCTLPSSEHGSQSGSKPGRELVGWSTRLAKLAGTERDFQPGTRRDFQPSTGRDFQPVTERDSQPDTERDSQPCTEGDVQRGIERDAEPESVNNDVRASYQQQRPSLGSDRGKAWRSNELGLA